MPVQGVDEHGDPLVHLDPAGRHAVGARDRATPSFISISLREISKAVSSRSRFHSHFTCHRRIARSVVTGIGTFGGNVKVAVLGGR